MVNSTAFLKKYEAGKPVVLAMALVVFLSVIHALRNASHFKFPGPFAEEGVVFLRGWLQGETPLVTAGYLNIFSSSLIGIVSKISPLYLPWITSGIAAVFSVLTMSYFLLPGWNKVLEFQYRLAFVVFFLGFGPFSEGAAIVLYSFWWFGIGAGFLTLEAIYLPEEAKRYRFAKAFYVLLGALSGPAVFLSVFPMLGVSLISRVLWEGRAGLRKFFGDLRWPIFTALVIAIAIQGPLLLSQSSTEKAISHRWVSWLQFPQAAFHQLHILVVMPTLISIEKVKELQGLRLWTLASTLITAGMIWLTFWAPKKRSSFTPSISVFLCCSGLLACFVTYLGRPHMFEQFRSSLYSTGFGGHRYTFIPGWFFLLGFLMAYAGWDSRRAKFAWAVITVPLLLYSGWKNFTGLETFENRHWSDSARQIEEYQKGLRDSVMVDANPQGWGFLVQRTKKPGN